MSETFMPEFREWPKTPRLFRDIVVTEKIDGTNAAIHFNEDGEVAAQSRKRLITPESDNFGFAGWVYSNREELFSILGPGLHFGEWWGQGIQRNYGMNRRIFSLFNTERWWSVDESGSSMDGRASQTSIYDQIDAVPILYAGVFSEAQITQVLRELRENGSFAAHGFMNPEGICIYHTQTRSVFKVTLDHNDAGKWEIVA